MPYNKTESKQHNRWVTVKQTEQGIYSQKAFCLFAV